jgi:hypothetical protein
VPLDRWRDIRGGRTLKPPHLATYLLVPACQQLMDPSWLVEHHGLYSTSRKLTVPQICSAPDRLVLLAVAVSARALTTRDKSPRLPLSHGLRTRPLPVAHAVVADY